jgi:hypothetical protein
VFMSVCCVRERLLCSWACVVLGASVVLGGFCCIGGLLLYWGASVVLGSFICIRGASVVLGCFVLYSCLCVQIYEIIICQFLCYAFLHD